MRDLDHPRVATLAKDNSGATLAAAAAARAAAEELARTGGTVTAADVQERVDRYRRLLLDALGAGGVCSGFLSVPYRPPVREDRRRGCFTTRRGSTRRCG